MDNLDSHYEPMDIDLSGNSSHAMDISFHKSNNENKADTDIPSVTEVNQPLHNDTFQQPTYIKKFHLVKPIETNSCCTTKIKTVCTVLILFLAVITYQVLNIQCSSDIHPDELLKSISTKLYGQSQAINSLIEALSVKDRSKLLFFYGSTGVGKTYTATLIMEHIGHYTNVYHYLMPGFMDTFTTDFMIGLTVCKHSTIIVDDLSAKDINIKTHIKDVIMKSQKLDKNITIILIYNCDNDAKDFEIQCDESFSGKLLHRFHSIDAYKKFIKFDTLKEEHLLKCIDMELGNRKLSNIEYEKLLKNFNVSMDGCKGVYTKLKFLEIS